MKTKLAFITLFSLALSACAAEEEPPAKPKEEPKKKRSNVVKVTLPVPPGKHVACTDLLPKTEPFTEVLPEEIGEIKDRGKSNSAATAVCSIIRGGEPPTKVKELKTMQDKYSKHGVLPGDEYCQVSAYCSAVNDEDAFKRKCEKDSNELVTLDGQIACLRATEKGAEYSYTYKFIEPDTKCVLEVLAGPSVEEKELVEKCAIAARAEITKESISNWK
jgi:CRISPR/Cas system-associated protein endoribonuclease Cas2